MASAQASGPDRRPAAGIRSDRVDRLARSMRSAARRCGLTIACLAAAGALAQGSAGGVAGYAAPLPQGGVAAAPAVPAATAPDSPVAAKNEEAQGPARQTKDGERQEKDQREALLLLFLQVLRSPR
jgi:hypothetical protein